MSTVSVELLIAVAVLILVAVAAGTACARLFMAASRSQPSAGASSREEV
jgi:hypothetical protein